MNYRVSPRTDFLKDLSDDELRHKLCHYGFPNIPVTETTRNILIRKLQIQMNREMLEKKNNRPSNVTYNRNVDRESTTSNENDTSKITSPPLNKYDNAGRKFNKSTSSIYIPRPSYSRNNLSHGITSTMSAKEHLRANYASPRMYVPPPISASDSEEDSDSINYSSCLEKRNVLSSKNISSFQFVNIRQCFHFASNWLMGRVLKNSKKGHQDEYSFLRKKNMVSKSSVVHQKIHQKVNSSPIKYFKSVISSFSYSFNDQNGLKHNIVPYLLLSMFLIFLCTVAVIYIWISLNYNNNTIDLNNSKFAICPYVEGHYQMESLPSCIEKEYVQEAIEVVKLLYEMLQKKAVNHCSNQEKYKEVSTRDIIEYMYTLNSGVDIAKIIPNIKYAQYLIKQNSHWNIISVDRQDVVESEDLTVDPIQYETFILSKSRLPLSCTVHNKLQAFFIIIGTAFLIGLFMLLINLIYTNFQRRRNEKIYTLEDVTNRIIDELVYMASKSDSTNVNCSITINHLRDKVIPIHRRKELESAWNDAIRNLELKDNRVQFGITLKNGEECKTIKWIADVGRDKIVNKPAAKQWQSPAFNTTNKIINPPTPCLKIRQMFDSTEINSPNLQQVIQDSILEKVGRRCKIYDIQFDNDSCCVYVRCASEKDAGVVHNAINGWWFDKRLVSIKFLRLQRYLTRFPKSTGGPICLLPSNSKNLSMSEFYKSEENCANHNDNGINDTN